MASVGTAYLEVVPSMSGFTQALDGALAPITSKFEGAAGKFGKAGTLGLAAVAIGAAAAGKALYDIGEQFDSAYDTIRIGTGATGQELEGLKNDFRDVVKNVPTDFDSAAKAITELHQRLGITGGPLRTLSKQMLELSRITKTDLDTNIQAVTRTFGDWSIKVKDQPKFLDKMFRASQQTGISVQDLGQQMVRYGAPLRQMGFGFSDAAAMVGKFEKEGVNARLVMGSLRIALGQMAQEGIKDPSQALAVLTQRIKDAGSAGEANKLAIETFGARAGPDMAAAIREGRFEYDDLVKSIDGGKETIMGAGQATMDFGERWTMLKNRVFVALEPIATKVFNAIGEGMLQLSNLMAGKGDISEKFRTAIADIRAAISPLIPVFQAAISEIKMILQGFATYLGGIFQVIRGIVQVFAGLFQGDFSKMWDGIKLIFQGALNVIIGVLQISVAPIRAVAQVMGGAISGAFSAAMSVVRGILNGIGSAASSVFNGVKNVAVGAFNAITTGITTPVTGAWGWVSSAATNVFNAVKTAAGNVASAVGSAISRLVGNPWHWMKDALDGVIGGIKGAVNAIVDWIKSRINDAKAVINAISGWIDGAKDAAGKAAERFVNAIKTPINALIAGINAIKIPSVGIHIHIPGPPSDLNFNTPEVDPFPDVRPLASGTQNFAGGLALVGEQGPELLNLPRGADVLNAQRTRSLLSGSWARRLSEADSRNGRGGYQINNFEIMSPAGRAPDAAALIAQVDMRLRTLGAWF